MLPSGGNCTLLLEFECAVTSARAHTYTHARTHAHTHTRTHTHACTGLPMDNYMNSMDYVEEVTRDALPPAGALGYADLGLKPNKVRSG